MLKFVRALKRSNRMLCKGIKLNKAFFTIRIIMTVYSCVVAIINIIIPKFLLEAIQIKSLKSACIILGYAFVINMIGAIIDRIYTPYAAVTSENMNVKITEEFLKKSFSLRLSYFEDFEAYNKYAVVFDNCTNIIHSSMDIFFGIFSSLLNMLLAISLLVWMNKIILVFMLLAILLQLIIDKKRKKIMFDFQMNVTKDNRQLNYLYRLFYVPQFMRDIRVNSLKDFVFQKKKEATDGLLDMVAHKNKEVSNISFTISSITHTETFFTSLYFVYESIRGKIVLGDFFVALNSYSAIKGALSSLLSTFNAIYENDLYITQFDEFMNEPEVKDNDNAVILDDIDNIEFRNVTFTYPNAVNQSLNNVSFIINKNERVAIVGCNGAGKTTIVKLLLRLYEPDSGTILINGRDIRVYQIASLRSSVAVLFQDYSIYPFSVSDNIKIGKNIPIDVVHGTLEKVGMLERVLKLPKGIDTPITSQMEEEGVELSGGESQRIAIARMYACDCKLLILDEPTSNLDSMIENELYENIFEDSKEKTVIIISHRMVFTYKMDRIICIKNGRIEEDGTHDELMQIEDGVYKRMVDINFQKYV